MVSINMGTLDSSANLGSLSKPKDMEMDLGSVPSGDKYDKSGETGQSAAENENKSEPEQYPTNAENHYDLKSAVKEAETVPDDTLNQTEIPSNTSIQVKEEEDVAKSSTEPKAKETT